MNKGKMGLIAALAVLTMFFAGCPLQDEEKEKENGNIITLEDGSYGTPGDRSVTFEDVGDEYVDWASFIVQEGGVFYHLKQSESSMDFIIGDPIDDFSKLDWFSSWSVGSSKKVVGLSNGKTYNFFKVTEDTPREGNLQASEGNTVFLYGADICESWMVLVGGKARTVVLRLAHGLDDTTAQDVSTTGSFLTTVSDSFYNGDIWIGQKSGSAKYQGFKGPPSNNKGTHIVITDLDDTNTVVVGTYLIGYTSDSAGEIFRDPPMGIRLRNTTPFLARLGNEIYGIDSNGLASTPIDVTKLTSEWIAENTGSMELTDDGIEITGLPVGAPYTFYWLRTVPFERYPQTCDREFWYASIVNFIGEKDSDIAQNNAVIFNNSGAKNIIVVRDVKLTGNVEGTFTRDSSTFTGGGFTFSWTETDPDLYVQPTITVKGANGGYATIFSSDENLSGDDITITKN